MKLDTSLYTIFPFLAIAKFKNNVVSEIDIPPLLKIRCRKALFYSNCYTYQTGSVNLVVAG
jgi:hypothetical protein